VPVLLKFGQWVGRIWLSNFKIPMNLYFGEKVLAIASLAPQAIGIVLVLAVGQPATAKTANEIRSEAKAVTVKIDADGKPGSGILIQKQGQVYTLVTNRHVVCPVDLCDSLPPERSYRLQLSDGRSVVAKSSAVKLLGKDLDLATIQFRTDRYYPIAKMAAPDNLKSEDAIFTAGFPKESGTFTFSFGKVLASVNKRLEGDKGEYGVIYDAFTLPGMSGGGVFNLNGELVAIHGKGDRLTNKHGIVLKDGGFNFISSENQIFSFLTSAKTGYNRGIPIRWLLQSLSNSSENSREIQDAVLTTADEYFITGFGQSLDLREDIEDVNTARKQAVQKLTQAIQLNPRYFYAYLARGELHEKLNQPKLSLVDYSKAINILESADNSFRRQKAKAYAIRGNLQSGQFANLSDGLADYNRAIVIDPQYYKAYFWRGFAQHIRDNRTAALADYTQAILHAKSSPDVISSELVQVHLFRGQLKNEQNDPHGAIADMSRAIEIDPQFDLAYFHRAAIKGVSFNDFSGALQDLDRAININSKNSPAYQSRGRLRVHFKIFKGAVEDYSEVIELTPTYAQAYQSRGELKIKHLNDRLGGIQDLRQAVHYFRMQGESQELQETIEQLQQLGATE
jgi:tetratricopeptide (TPR) repeat protein